MSTTNHSRNCNGLACDCPSDSEDLLDLEATIAGLRSGDYEPAPWESVQEAEESIARMIETLRRR